MDPLAQARQELKHASGIGLATSPITSGGTDHPDLARPGGGLKGLGGGELTGIQPLPGHQLGPDQQSQGAVLAAGGDQWRQALITTMA